MMNSGVGEKSRKQMFVMYGGLLLMGAFLSRFLMDISMVQTDIFMNAQRFLPASLLTWLEFLGEIKFIIIPVLMLFLYTKPLKVLFPTFIVLGGLLVVSNILAIDAYFPSSFLLSAFLIHLWKAMGFVVFFQLCNQLIPFKNALWFYPLLGGASAIGLLGSAIALGLLGHFSPIRSFMTMDHVLTGMTLVGATICYWLVMKFGISSADREIFSKLRVPFLSTNKSDKIFSEPMFWMLLTFLFIQGALGYFATMVVKYLINLEAAGELYNQMMGDWFVQAGMIQVTTGVLLIFVLPLLGWVRTLWVALGLMVAGMIGAFYLLSTAILPEQVPQLITLITCLKNIWMPVVTILVTSLFILYGPHMRFQGFMFLSLMGYSGIKVFNEAFAGGIQTLVDPEDAYMMLWSRFTTMAILLVLMSILGYYIAQDVRKRSKI